MIERKSVNYYTLNIVLQKTPESTKRGGQKAIYPWKRQKALTSAAVRKRWVLLKVFNIDMDLKLDVFCIQRWFAGCKLFFRPKLGRKPQLLHI